MFETLPSDWISQAYALLASEAAEREHKQREYQHWLWQNPYNADEQFNLIVSALHVVNPGDLEYDEWVSIGMSLASVGDYRLEEAWVDWSASSSKSTSGGRTAAKKWHSFKRSGYTIGTLFFFAKQYGWKFPERKYQDPREPDRVEYQRLLNEQAEQERVERVEEEVRGFGKVKQFLKRLLPKRLPFELPPPKKLPKVLQYGPSNLPWYGKVEHSPKILFTPEQLPQLLAEAREKGWRDILDSSGTGMGKSYRYATLSLSTLGVDDGGRAWLLSQTHRNPTTSPAEHNYADMPVRTRTGFVVDTERKTATGKPYLRYPTEEEARSLHEGNCNMADLIHAAAAKGIDNANEEAQTNPFCAICKHSNYCQQGSGQGFGFRSERRKLFQNERSIRSSIDSLPKVETYPYQKDAAILDEALQMLRPARTITADLRDFDAQCGELEHRLPHVSELLTPLKRALAPLVRGNEVPYYGLNHEQLLPLLPSVPEDLTDDVLNQIRMAMAVHIESLSGGTPDTILTQEDTERITSLKVKVKRRSQKLEKIRAELFKLQQIEDDLKAEGQQLTLGVESQGFKYTSTEAKKMWERSQNLLNMSLDLETDLAQLRSELEQQERGRQMVKNFNRGQYQEVKQSLQAKIDALPNQWLVPFLEVWSGQSKGALRCDRFGLKVTVYDDRHNRILNSINTRYYLDATATPQILALYRQVPVSQILWIEQEQPPADNLDFIWVTGFGLAGKNRSDSCDERLKTFHSFLKQKHLGLVTFDWKAKKEVLGADGHYFSDSTRGTNEFIDHMAIAAIGLPMPNVVSYYDLWLSMKTDTSPSFDDFYRQLVDAEIIQSVGRLRANRRPDEKLTFYLIGDTEKCRVANYQPPAQLNPRRVEVRDFCPAAASKSEQKWLGICEFVKCWWSEHGELPTQQEVSKQTGTDRSWISKLAAQFIGGWKFLKKVIQSLVDPPYNRWNLIDPLPEDFEWVAQTYLPLVAQQPSLEVAQEIDGLIEVYGWQGWLQILSQTSQTMRLNLIAAMFQDGLLRDKSQIHHSLFKAAG